MFSDLAAKSNRLVIHFHGGLVSREAGVAAATQLGPEYRKAGAEPLFIVWETGIADIISQNVQAIFDEEVFQTILRRVTQFVKGKLDKIMGPPGARAVAGGLSLPYESEAQAEIDEGRAGKPMFVDTPVENVPEQAAPTPEQALTDHEKAQIEAEIDSDGDLKNRVRAIAASRYPEGDAGAKSVASVAPVESLMDDAVVKGIAGQGAAEVDEERSRSILGAIALGKHIVAVVGSVIWRFAQHRDHGPYLTIVEEVMREFYVRAAGRFLWQEMKGAIDSAFGFEPECGGAALVKTIHDAWKANVKPCLTIVGHSAGAIYAARLLRELHSRMDADFRVNVVFIAPACTFKYLAESLKAAEGRLANLRIFGMSDAVERRDEMVPLIFPASLLYFVSGVLEDDSDEPLAGMQRYYSGPYAGSSFGEIAYVKGFDRLQGAHSYAWAQVSGFEGANCDMVTHGGWANAPQTLASVQYLIQRGCGDAW